MPRKPIPRVDFRDDRGIWPRKTVINEPEGPLEWLQFREGEDWVIVDFVWRGQRISGLSGEALVFVLRDIGASLETARREGPEKYVRHYERVLERAQEFFDRAVKRDLDK